ncbi:MAG: cytochrome c-type biogenesis protein [Tabrizicola sp.]|uniref:cytochrome c-type biogenesis protein n=1 Tax=Tabrizicola sp. TaxID=2005166 RepID=UPI002735731B|nr:cytochrome c-type biogenesis protein [Tabrizicola sp.]MDP3262949.1 cytochrome c-type biogenesis protein CcmH [Tabrizicola sp.]MDP3649382.1 cytochrome c-type biogenesis protein CcmH [Paracoccaceae bacterium]MDZ4069700.1 cytochrome c-type biogenesis protein [Tabrizicola sp.]
MKRLVVMLALLASPALAVQPDEILPDPALEARAREISRDIRCPVCQGESIDDSVAPISRDLRIIIRERLVAGDSDAEVVDYIVARYGEFVLFNPRPEGSNLILWLAGPALLLAGLGIAVATQRRQVATPEVELSDSDEARLREILKG